MDNRLTTREAAKILGYASVYSFRNALSKGRFRLKYSRVGGNMWFELKDVEDYIKNNQYYSPSEKVNNIV